MEAPPIQHPLTSVMFLALIGQSSHRRLSEITFLQFSTIQCCIVGYFRPQNKQDIKCQPPQDIIDSALPLQSLALQHNSMLHCGIFWAQI